jgi:hypothetical protein
MFGRVVAATLVFLSLGCDEAGTSGTSSTQDSSGSESGAGGGAGGSDCKPFLTDKPTDGSTSCELPCNLTVERGDKWYCTITCPGGAACPANHECFEQPLGDPSCLLPCATCPTTEPCQSDCPTGMTCGNDQEGSACKPN